MTPQIIIAAVMTLGGFVSGWTLNSWRYGAKETDRVTQQIIATQYAAAVSIRTLDNALIAQNNSETRARALRVDAVGSRNALIGLSNATDTAMRDAQSAHDTCIIRANTLGELFIASSTEYESLAEKAGRHTNDLQKMIDIWPKFDR